MVRIRVGCMPILQRKEVIIETLVFMEFFGRFAPPLRQSPARYVVKMVIFVSFTEAVSHDINGAEKRDYFSPEQ
jgi:hypothetical protein